MNANATTGKPAGVFRKNDLWDYVDAARNRYLNQKSIEQVIEETPQEPSA
jgi:hypothetical protein